VLSVLALFGTLVISSSSCSVWDIPGVGSKQRCDHKSGCPKRAPNCDVSGPCTVVCANSTGQGKERWECVNNIWQLTEGQSPLHCSPLLRPCPPFPSVRAGACQNKTMLGYKIRDGKCRKLTGCESDRSLYAKGELFGRMQACQKRLQFCNMQHPNTNVPPSSRVAATSSNSTNSSSHSAPASSVPAWALPPGSSSSASSGSFVLSAGSSLPGSRNQAEVAAKSVSGGILGALQTLVPGTWGTAPVNVDTAIRELKVLNPTFNFMKNYQFEQYPLVVSDHFARLLYDDGNFLVRIVRQ